MAHFCELIEVDGKKIVDRVIVVNNYNCMSYEGENEEVGAEYCRNLLGGEWIQTSYNGSFRYHYAGKGYEWMPSFVGSKGNGAFVAPQPYPSWTLDDVANWQAPTAMPIDGKMYQWNEELLQWEERI